MVRGPQHGVEHHMRFQEILGRVAREQAAPKGLGPFISVWISLVAIRHTEAGIAQVLLGMVPIFVVLPSWVVYRDRPTPQSLAGIVLAVVGGAFIFLR